MLLAYLILFKILIFKITLSRLVSRACVKGKNWASLMGNLLATRRPLLNIPMLLFQELSPTSNRKLEYLCRSKYIKTRANTRSCTSWMYRVHRKIFRGPSTLLVLLYTQTKPCVELLDEKWNVRPIYVYTRKVNIKITIQTGSLDHRDIN